MSLKVKLLAWLRTIYLLIKHRFDTKAALQETDQEHTEVVSRIILRQVSERGEHRN